MADSHHSSRPPANAAHELVRADVGGWISGPAVDGTEAVPADSVRVGDVLILGDGARAEVTDLRRGDYWLNSGRHGPGVAIGWRSGSASGVMFREASEVLLRLAP